MSTRLRGAEAGATRIECDPNSCGCQIFSKAALQFCTLHAAAPELLEALKLARKVLSVACGEEAPYIRIAFSKIDPAIAKAEGR